jgi:hypothetical protein
MSSLILDLVSSEKPYLPETAEQYAQMSILAWVKTLSIWEAKVLLAEEERTVLGFFIEWARFCKMRLEPLVWYRRLCVQCLLTVELLISFVMVVAIGITECF